jgi:2-polyprenyl-6-methoxyphenol hydroxylase-like FAD-dependent oxidoreductase
LPLDKKLWSRSFPHLAPLFARIDDQGRWDLFEVTKLKRWSKGRAAVIGDAAHCMTPSLGQGAGCAMMNALSLAATLERFKELSDGLASWETAERPLTEHTQDLARRLTEGVVSAVASGTKWTDEALRTAIHVPTGARAHLGLGIDVPAAGERG